MSYKEVQPDGLSYKQINQLWNIAEKAQTHLPFEEVTFLKLVELCKTFCFQSCYNEKYGSGANDLFKKHLEEFKIKYYPYGVKVNKRKLSGEHVDIVMKHQSPRFIVTNIPEPYTPIEKIAFVRTFRACRDCFYAGMTDESTDELIGRLKRIRIMINK